MITFQELQGRDTALEQSLSGEPQRLWDYDIDTLAAVTGGKRSEFGIDYPHGEWLKLRMTYNPDSEEEAPFDSRPFLSITDHAKINLHYARVVEEKDGATIIRSGDAAPGYVHVLAVKITSDGIVSYIGSTVAEDTMASTIAPATHHAIQLSLYDSRSAVAP